MNEPQPQTETAPPEPPANDEPRVLSRAWQILLGVLGLGAFLLGFVLLCAFIVSSLDVYNPVQTRLGLLALALLTLGGGGTLAWHSLRSLDGAPSQPLKLWPTWALLGIFALFLTAGLGLDFISEANLLLPPLLAVAATMPPLAAIAWFAGGDTAVISRRRAMLSFLGGSTVGVGVTLFLSAILSGIIFALILGLGEAVIGSIEDLFTELSNRQVADALTDFWFVLALVQLAILAPLTEELSKPLITLPWLRRVSRRQAFLLGAFAGAGFAALENMLYAGFASPFWAGILLVRALGAAIHPVGAGLMALAWQAVLTRQPGAGRLWLKNFGIAAGLHALWNGGSLIVITLAGVRFFGQLPPEIDTLGISSASVTLALLAVLGGLTLWVGRRTMRNLDEQPRPEAAAFRVSDRAVALWALACLLAIVPAGIAGLQFILR